MHRMAFPIREYLRSSDKLGVDSSQELNFQLTTIRGFQHLIVLIHQFRLLRGIATCTVQISYRSVYFQTAQYSCTCPTLKRRPLHPAAHVHLNKYGAEGNT